MTDCFFFQEHQTQVGMENLDKERASRGVDTARRLATMESELLDGRSHTMGLTSKVLEGWLASIHSPHYM